MANPICETCKADNKTSDVFRTSQKIIGTPTNSFRDDGGNVHWHNPVVKEQWFTCTNHHAFMVVVDPLPCPSCANHWRDQKDDGV
jgi:hypothetical protein